MNTAINKRTNPFRKLITSVTALAAAATMLVVSAPAANAATVPAVPGITANAHVQNIGWQGTRSANGLSGVTVGTTGQSLRLEAVNIGLVNMPSTQGGIRVNAHVANVGWQGYRSAVAGRTVTAGTTGQGNAIEAVQIQLYGPISKYFDVEYQLHLEGIGWQGYRRNGATAGTTGQGRRSEALNIRLRRK